MRTYLDLLNEVLCSGERRPDRTGTGTRSLFARSLKFDLAQGFPLLTTKRIHVKSVVAELLWFLSGDTNIKALQRKGVTIWDEWADASGDLGPVYGQQWRAWPDADGQTIDQIKAVVEDLRHNPFSRRHIVCAWNVGCLEHMALPPCHCLFQFYVAGGKLSCQMYQRSADIFLGVPFNIASYALLTHMVAHTVGLEVGEYSHVFGDVHLYDNHEDQAREQLSRTPRDLPQLHLNPEKSDLLSFRDEDITFSRYDPHAPIRAAVAV